MAFDPLDMLAFAESVALETEAQIRTAINRAYYAVFLKARDRLLARGLIAEIGSSQEHGRVIHALRANYRGQAAGRLAHLRTMRETADYDTRVTVDKRAALDAIETANDIRRLLAPDWDTR